MIFLISNEFLRRLNEFKILISNSFYFFLFLKINFMIRKNDFFNENFVVFYKIYFFLLNFSLKNFFFLFRDYSLSKIGIVF